jgi:murein DD-endopeptidase MepM/ murein hydrolase activator NlpD
VVAAADGVVTFSGTAGNPACGTLVIIRHTPFDYETIYCHLNDATASIGKVKRGDVIGHIGTSGLRPGPGFEHLHFGLSLGGDRFVDPQPKIVGCFDPRKEYPADRLVLTYPVQCKD